MGGERGDAGFSATSKSGSTSLFNIGWLVAVLEVGAQGKGDKPVMTWRTVVVLVAAAITIEDKRAKDTPDTSQEIVVFLCTILSPRYLISSLSRADPPGSGFNNTNFSLLLCPENPENTANGSGKILESDSAQLRQFERVTIIVSGPYTNVGSNRPPSRPPLAFPMVAPRNWPRCGCPSPKPHPTRLTRADPLATARSARRLSNSRSEAGQSAALGPIRPPRTEVELRRAVPTSSRTEPVLRRALVRCRKPSHR